EGATRAHFLKTTANDVNKFFASKRVTLLPLRYDVFDDKYECYCDDDGVYSKDYSLNVMGNPLFEEELVVNLAMMGGPRGPLLVLHKRALNIDLLLRTFKAYDALLRAYEEEEEEDDTNDGNPNEDNDASAAEQETTTVK